MSLLVGLELYRTSIPEKTYQDVRDELSTLVKMHGNFAKLAILPTGKQVLVKIIPGSSPTDIDLYYAISADNIGKMGFKLEGSKAQFLSVSYNLRESLRESNIHGMKPNGETYWVEGKHKDREVINLKASLPTLKSIVELAPDYYDNT